MVAAQQKPDDDDIQSDPVNQVDLNIFIGDSTSAQDKPWLTSTGITHIINTAEEIQNFYADPKTSGGYRPRYFNLRLKDNPTPGDEDLLGVLERTFRYIKDVIRINPSAKISIHCHMGKSRSASIVIYYLMRSRGWGYEEALEFARSKRPIVSPNGWYAQQLKDVERLLQTV